MHHPLNTSQPRSRLLWMGWLLCAVCLAVSWLGYRFEPPISQSAADDSNRQAEVEAWFPKRFGEWSLVENRVQVVQDPEVQYSLDRLYSAVLIRTYRNTQGYHVMLVVAYGEDQRGGLQGHQPETCYPAQGFTVTDNQVAQIETSFGVITGRRLSTQLANRFEPVTYWFLMGSQPVTGRFERRWQAIRLAMQGHKVDGLLLRVSSVDRETQRAFDRQLAFVNELLAAMTPEARSRVTGL
jgi:EpsI family protein